ncbi:MAG TPA: DNA-directed RNA polymerase subunit omega [Pyrinomonadaceae bacterium]|nr:DNA-directed RNA polymerase subunit omega [Pyrinomonadaceae bacterium]
MRDSRSKATSDGFGTGAAGDQWPGVTSRFQLVVLAALRSKQLLRGAKPRLDADPLRRRNTSIALEEIKLGLVPFDMNGSEEQKHDGNGASGRGKNDERSGFGADEENMRGRLA